MDTDTSKADDQSAAKTTASGPVPIKELDPVTDREEEDPYLPDTPLEMQGPNHRRRLDRADTNSNGIDRDDTFEPATIRQDDLQPPDTARNARDDTPQMRPAVGSQVTSTPYPVPSTPDAADGEPRTKSGSGS